MAHWATEEGLAGGMTHQKTPSLIQLSVVRNVLMARFSRIQTLQILGSNMTCLLSRHMWLKCTLKGLWNRVFTTIIYQVAGHFYHQCHHLTLTWFLKVKCDVTIGSAMCDLLCKTSGTQSLQPLLVKIWPHNAHFEKKYGRQSAILNWIYMYI